MELLRSKKTIIVILTGLLVIEFFVKNKYLFIACIALGGIGVISDYLTIKIDKVWYILARVLGYVSNKILLSVIFFLFLVPIAFFYKITRKSKMEFKSKNASFWITRNLKYTKNDLENIW